MENKALILLMSCNQALYEEEEMACRETFLKDAEYVGMKYYFYKGLNEMHKTQMIDNEEHTIYLDKDDSLSGTYQKTIAAFEEALKIDAWDYLIKTNVSTWLNIPKIKDAIESWPGKDDLNIYGARYIANKMSMNVPFPRGCFVIFSRSLIEGIVQVAKKLINSKSMPKTDDTFICLASLYFLQKENGLLYMERIKEVPAVNSWVNNIEDAPEYNEALSIRCKNEKHKERTAENMRKVHGLKQTENVKPRYFRPVNLIETKYGMLTYDRYEKFIAAEKSKDETPATDLKKELIKSKLESIKEKALS